MCELPQPLGPAEPFHRYTCNSVANTRKIRRKVSQGGSDPDAYYENHSCFVLEQEAPIDGINNPQWGYDEFIKPGQEYNWTATYSFSVMKD